MVLGDPHSAGYKTFRAGMAEYVALLPPNSHGEANPADKDPVPPPFDNTYNSPEHDAFVLKVKYQRNDTFFTDNMVDGADRARLNQAWNDLFGSWPYHDAYLGMLADHYELDAAEPHDRRTSTPAQIAALPAAVRPHVTALRAHYDEVMQAQALAQPGHVTDALTFASRAWRRPLTAAEKASLRAFYQKSRTVQQLDHDAAIRALIARILVSPAFLYRVETVAARRRAAAERLGAGQPPELLPLVVDSRRGAAARRGRRRAERSGAAREAGQADDRRSEGAPARDRVLRPVARLLSLRSSTAASTPAASPSSPTR